MANAHCDVVVIGAGIHGRAIMELFSRKKYSVIGLERGPVDNTLGASHALHRLTRRPNELKIFKPMQEVSRLAFEELGKRTGTEMLPKGSGFYAADVVDVMGAMEGFMLANHETCDPKPIRGWEFNKLGQAQAPNPYSYFHLDSEAVVVLREDLRRLAMGNAMAGYLSEARKAGADIRFNTPVHAIDYKNTSVTTEVGDVIYAGTIVIAGGYGTNTLLQPSGYQLPITAEQRDAVNFRRREAWPVTACPFIYETDFGIFYGMPTGPNDEYIKVGMHDGNSGLLKPGQQYFAANKEVVGKISTFARTRMNNVDPQPHHIDQCIYTISKDKFYRIGALPGHKNIIVAWACNGNSAKVAPAVAMAVLEEHDGTPCGYDRSSLGLGMAGERARFAELAAI